MSKNKYFDANYARYNGRITRHNDATLIFEVMKVIKYYVHDPEILRMTSEHEIEAVNVKAAINVPVNVSDRDDNLEQLRDRALVERSRGAILDYWRVFLAKYTAGDIGYDVNGLFRPEFDIDITYEE